MGAGKRWRWKRGVELERHISITQEEHFSEKLRHVSTQYSYVVFLCI
jgi:hypothetical protein